MVHAGGMPPEEGETQAGPAVRERPGWWTEEDEEFFSEAAANALPIHGTRDHAINLLSDPPRHTPIYPLHAKELEVLKEYIEKALERGWIRRSDSPIAAPVLFVPKKGGELRLCVDYRGLNGVTVKDRTPILIIDIILERLTRARIFTKLNIKNAYYRVRIREGDE